MLHEKQSRKCERRPAADFGAVAGLLQVPLLAVVFDLLGVRRKAANRFMFWLFFCRIILISMHKSYHRLYNSC